jgi:hypothetical protein
MKAAYRLHNGCGQLAIISGKLINYLHDLFKELTEQVFYMPRKIDDTSQFKE